MTSFLEFFHDKRILITGNTGFKGSWLTSLLLSAGSQIIGYALEPEDASPSLYRILQLEDRITQHFANICDQDSMTDVLKREEPEIVFHLAAQPLVRRSYLEPIRTFATNCMGTAYLLQAIREVGGVRATVVVTSDKVYENCGDGRPKRENDRLGSFDPYSASKACAEMIAHSYASSYFSGDLPLRLVATVRAGNVIGGGDWSEDRLIPDLVRSVYSTTKPLSIRHPKAIRPWQHVLDPLFGYLKLARRLDEGDRSYAGAWNFGPDEASAISVESLIQRIQTLLDMRIEVAHAPDLSCPEAAVLRLDSSQAHQRLDWHPRLSLEVSLAWTLNWYRDYYEGGDVRHLTEQQIDQFLERATSAS